MLILTRRKGEVIAIGDLIKVKICGVKGRQVRIGVEAPDEVSVHRREVLERIRREAAAEVVLANEPIAE